MKRFRIAAAVALLVACDPITEPLCACSPPGGGTAVITGSVTDAAANPVVGAIVQVRLMNNATCDEMPVTVTRTATSGTAGRFRHTESWSGGDKCFRLWAEPPQGSSLSASESRLVRIDFGMTVSPDSVDVALQLR